MNETMIIQSHIPFSAPMTKSCNKDIIHSQILQRSVFDVQCSVFNQLQRSVFDVQCSVFNQLQRSVFDVQCSVLFPYQLATIQDSRNHNNPEDNRYIYHSDHLGSSAFLTDIDGNPTQHLQYLPFGEPFIEQRSVTDYYTPYTFSAKERDLETGYSYFGARYYDADISVWLSVDPLADKYPSMSAYMYCAGNPVILTDPDGRDIVIPYKNKRGLGRLFERKKYYTYKPGEDYTGNNKFLKQTVEALNYIVNNGADIGNVTKTIADDKDNTVSLVKQSNFNNTTGPYYNRKRKQIEWPPLVSMPTIGENGKITGYQSPALSLYHEFVHAYIDFYGYNNRTYDELNNQKVPNENFPNLLEKTIIQDFESEAAKVLQSKGFKESTRNNWEGGSARVKCPTCIKELKVKKNDQKMNINE